MESIVLRSCGVCTRVHLEHAWIPEDEAIRLLQSYALSTPPSFVHALCPPCSTERAERRLVREMPDGMLAAAA
jgi:hypothetical protein